MAIVACFVFPRKIGHPAFWEFCNTIPSRADVARPRPKFILSLVSQAIPIPLSSQKCLGQLQSLLARENLRPQPPAREIILIEISGWPVVRESHLEDPAHGRARKAATRADAGGDSSNGYWYIRIDGKGYLGHRLAWLYMHGHFPDGALDHKNHNRSRIADLREATRSQNTQIRECSEPTVAVSKAPAGLRSATNIAPKSCSEEKPSAWDTIKRRARDLLAYRFIG